MTAEPALFKAVGVVTADVKFSQNGINTITIGCKCYRLKYSTTRLNVFNALKQHIKKTGKSQQRLIVHPRFIHFPNREQPYILYFELVGFKGTLVKENDIFDELKDKEFTISGLWQFIPVCRVPCVSVFRNFTEERKIFIKAAEPIVKMRFLKSSHIPVLWHQSEVKPFRFNPKADKTERLLPKFVQTRAIFVPESDNFKVTSQFALPLDEPPKFLKVSKKEKSAIAKNTVPKQTAKPSLRRETPKPNLAKTK